MKELRRIEFGNPLLRQVASRLTLEDIASEKIQELIKNMRHTLISKKLGVGLAAPQVGVGVALSVISIRPMPHRPKAKEFDLVIINPEIVEYLGKKEAMWEGCLSAGKSGLFAKVPRYKKLTLKYQDEKGDHYIKQFEGLPAHAIQHETDHLKGGLFVDKVKDTGTYMTYKEYKARVVGVRL